MKFLVDAQLPKALCAWLIERGHEAVHVTLLADGPLSDAAVAARAARDSFVILSKDEDFVALRRQWSFTFVWLRCGNTTKQALRLWLEDRWESMEALLKTGDNFIELH